MQPVYCDASATTPPCPEALRAWLRANTESWGNPSSRHGIGRKGAGALSRARTEVAELLGANPGFPLFVSCGTEANNGILQSLAHHELPVFYSAVEHDSVRAPAEVLGGEELPVDRDGRVDPDLLARKLDGPAIVCVQLANGDVGTIQDIRALAEVCRVHDAWLHVDGAQAVGRMPVCIRDLGCDSFSCSGHKFHAPRGVGLLWIRSPNGMIPFLLGGSQEGGLRSGTENVAGAASMAEALRQAVSRIEEISCRLRALRDRFLAVLFDLCGDRIVPILPGGPTLPHVVTVAFPSHDAYTLLAGLDRHGVCASVGSACSCRRSKGFRTLAAMGLHDYAGCSVRFSFHRYQTPEDAEEAAYRVARSIAR